MSYFRRPSDLPVKTVIMMKQAKALDYIITATENEAFILESSLIKKHMPRYNVILRDDKQYPVFKTGHQGQIPKAEHCQKIKKRTARSISVPIPQQDPSEAR